MQRHPFLWAVSLAVGALCGSELQAQDAALTGFYAEVQAGSSNFDLLDQFERSIEPDNVDGDDRDTGFGVSVGYEVTNWFAVEANFVNYGQFALNGVSTLPALTVRSEVEPRSYGLHAKLSYPFAEQFIGYAKLGVARWDVDVESEVREATQDRRFSEDDSGKSFAWTLGAEYRLAKQWRLGLGYSQLEAGDTVLEEEKLGLLYASVGVTF
jgi:OOP family OmpA-OmpF porin